MARTPGSSLAEAAMKYWRLRARHHFELLKFEWNYRLCMMLLSLYQFCRWVVASDKRNSLNIVEEMITIRRERSAIRKQFDAAKNVIIRLHKRDLLQGRKF